MNCMPFPLTESAGLLGQELIFYAIYNYIRTHAGSQSRWNHFWLFLIWLLLLDSSEQLFVSCGMPFSLKKLICSEACSFPVPFPTLCVGLVHEGNYMFSVLMSFWFFFSSLFFFFLFFQSTAMSEPQCYYNETIAFFYNRSGKHLATEWNTVSKLVMGLGITVCIFIMLANLLVMVAIYVNRRFHFPIYYLMANLAAADFFAGLAYFYLMFNTGPNTRRLTVSTWLLRQGLIDTSLTASVANLLAIAIERHITVFRMQLHTRMSNRRVVVVIVVIWTMAIVMGAIPSVGWNCICDITHCSNMAPLYSDSYLVFWAIFNLVTFVVMVVLYAHIFGYVRQRTMRMSRHSSGPRRNRDTMMSLLKTVVIVLGKCLLCPPCSPSSISYQVISVMHGQLLGVSRIWKILEEMQTIRTPRVH